MIAGLDITCLQAVFAERLRQLQAERARRQDFLRGEPAWVHYERQQMLAAVNTARTLLHRPALELDQVIATEEASYYDRYVDRFSQGCAELVYA